MQGGHVLQDKVPGALVVEVVESADDTVGDVDETDVGELLVRDEGVGANVVGADPDGVDGFLGLDLEELLVLLVGRDFVLADGGEEVAAEGSGG